MQTRTVARPVQRPTRPKLTKDDLFRPLATPLPRNRPSLGYRISLLLVAVLVLLLPLVYLALVAGVGWCLWWYATHVEPGFGILRAGRTGGRVVIFAMIAYVTVYLVGGVLLLLMLKPLWPRRSESEELIGVSRAEQPVLYEFVDRLCRMLGAPAPQRIALSCDVNAAAGVKKSLFGLGGEMTLIVGMPLAAGLSLRQLTGVLAHEFGHFAQGGAVWLERVIGSTLATLARAVFARDPVDDALEELAQNENGLLSLFGHLSKLAVWLVRRILFVLFYVGARASRIVTRQREYDADRYEARVVGSRVFTETSDRLLQLQVASGKAYASLRQSFAEKTLADDLPALIASEASHVDARTLRDIRGTQWTARRHWSDTHPPDHLRIAAAQRLNADGVFDVDAPASLLFRDFGRLCKEVTLRHYKVDHDLPLSQCGLIPTSQLVRKEEKQSANADALRRYTQDLATPARPLFPDRELPPPEDRDAALDLLVELRNDLLKQRDRLYAASRALDEADELLLRADVARAMLAVGVRKVSVNDRFAAKLGRSAVTSKEQLDERETAWKSQRSATYDVIRPLRSDLLLRLHLATQLADPPTAPKRATTPKKPSSDDLFDPDDPLDAARAPYDLSDGPSLTPAAASPASAARRQEDTLAVLGKGVAAGRSAPQRGPARLGVDGPARSRQGLAAAGGRNPGSVAPSGGGLGAHPRRLRRGSVSIPALEGHRAAGVVPDPRAGRREGAAAGTGRRRDGTG